MFAFTWCIEKKIASLTFPAFSLLNDKYASNKLKLSQNANNEPFRLFSQSLGYFYTVTLL